MMMLEQKALAISIVAVVYLIAHSLVIIFPMPLLTFTPTIAHAITIGTQLVARVTTFRAATDEDFRSSEHLRQCGILFSQLFYANFLFRVRYDIGKAVMQRSRKLHR
jgi:uncharacterized membrane protein